MPKNRSMTGDSYVTAVERRMTGFGNSLPDAVRNHIVGVLGEFVGTFLFLFFAFSSTQIANAAAEDAHLQRMRISSAPNVSVLLYIAFAFGFSLAVNVWVFYRISGGMFNPAVTLGLCVVGAVDWIRGVLVILAQLVGGIASAGVVSALFPGPMAVRTSLGGGTSVIQGLFIEIFLTSQLVLVILLLAVEKHKATFLAPVGIGLALFIAQLAGVYYTGGSLNPARSFGPDVVLGKFDPYHWIYWVGPCLGSLLAAVFYSLFRVLGYETANPGQDSDHKDTEPHSLSHDGADERDPPRTISVSFAPRHVHQRNTSDLSAIPQAPPPTPRHSAAKPSPPALAIPEMITTSAAGAATAAAVSKESIIQQDSNSSTGSYSTTSSSNTSSGSENDAASNNSNAENSAPASDAPSPTASWLHAATMEKGDFDEDSARFM